MRIQPVVVISVWAWLLIRFWKPLLVFGVVLYVLVVLMAPIAMRVVVDTVAPGAAATFAARATPGVPR